MDMTNFASSGVTVDFVKASPSKVLVLLNSGVEREFQGKKKPVFLAEIDGKQKDYIPNKTTMQRLMQAWGPESNNWIGKTVQMAVGIVNGRESVIGSPYFPPVQQSYPGLQVQGVQK